MFQRLQFISARRQFNKSREEFYEAMAQSVGDGISLGRFLERKAQRATDRKRPDAILYETWAARYREFGRMGRVIQGDVPFMDQMILGLAEEAGTFRSGTEFLISQTKNIKRLKTQTRAALMGAALPATIALAVLFGFSYFMIPLLSQVVPPHEWPFFGQLLLGVAGIIQNFGIVGIAFFLACTVAFIFSLSRWSGKSRSKLDQYFPYRVYREYMGSVFLVTLASLVQSGVSFGAALDRTRAASSPWLAWYIQQMAVKGSHSSSVIEGLDVGLLHEDIMDNLLDAAEVSTPQRAIESIGLRSIDLVVVRVKRLADTVGIVGKLLVAVTLGLVVLGTITTTSSMSGLVRGLV